MRIQVFSRWTIGLSLMMVLITSCRKGDSGGGDNGGSGIGLLGHIYYEFADNGVSRLDQPGFKSTLFLQEQSKRNGWDVSYDNQYKLEASTILHNYDDIQFTLSKISDGSIVNEFVYSPLNGGSHYQSGSLSPDGKLIGIPASFDEGIVILNTDGSLVAHIEGINGQKFERLGAMSWLPNNGLLVAHQKNIIRIDPPYTSGKLVKEMNYTEWGDIAVNREGTKIALVIDKHIHMMDMDGGNLQQVTNSKFAESGPEFSPDGRHLLVVTDYR
ncbi:MAG: hypothetical protein EOO02_03100, partial [Chitinophagaceae bacterium]